MGLIKDWLKWRRFLNSHDRSQLETCDISWQNVKRLTLVEFDDFLRDIDVGSEEVAVPRGSEEWLFTLPSVHPSDFARLWAYWGLENGYKVELYRLRSEDLPEDILGALLEKDGLYIPCIVTYGARKDTKQGAVDAFCDCVGLPYCKTKRLRRLKK